MRILKNPHSPECVSSIELYSITTFGGYYVTQKCEGSSS